MQDRLTIDTNSEVLRYVRAFDQFNFEKDTLSSLKGSTWSVRWEAIRNSLFGKYDESLKGSRNVDAKDYPNAKLVSDIYRPALERFTDGVEVNLPDLDNQSDKGFRLAVVNYALGVLMHPALDGNGQSSRLLALSYIQEHCPEFKDKYLPIKYTSDPRETKIRGWDEGIFQDVTIEYPDLDSMTPEDQELLKLFLATCEIGSSIMRDNNHIPQEQLGEWMEDRRKAMVDDILQKLGVTMEQVMPRGIYTPDIALAKYIGGILSSKYPGYVFEMYPDTKYKKQYLLTVALTTAEGLHSLRSFIDNGDCGENTTSNVTFTLDAILKTTEAQLRSALSGESGEKHRNRHEKQILKRRM